MKRIGVTQRVEVVPAYGERRDCLDQNWFHLLKSIGIFAIPIPNVWARRENVLKILGLDGVILSGGNDPASAPNASGTAPERDLLETRIIEQCIAGEIPVLGVCRGLMMINLHFGGALTPTTGHRAVRHEVTRAEGAKVNWPAKFEVNSFHNYAIPPGDLAAGLTPAATAADGSIEAFSHDSSRCFGIMWHPERESPFTQRDLDLLGHLFLSEEN